MATKTTTLHQVYQFKITLLGIEPAIWRQILMSDHYSFWDLHVALQDAMGWQDCHLHEFRFQRQPNNSVIGIPDDEGFGFGDPVKAGWEIPITQYFQKKGEIVDYNYDFGDDWRHELVLDDILPHQIATHYPQCIDGVGICPPEDCGGIPGFDNLLEILADPTHEEYEDMTDWLDATANNYGPDAAPFNPKSVKFDDPKKRWEIAFGTRH